MSKAKAKIFRGGTWFILESVQPCKFAADDVAFSRYCHVETCCQKDASIGVYKSVMGKRTLVTTTVCLMKEDDIFRPEPRYGVVDINDNKRRAVRTRHRDFERRQ